MPSTPPDFNNELRALANRWAILARDYARDGKAAEAKDPARGHYLRGIAEGYYKAATDLAAQLKQVETRGAVGAVPESTAEATPAGLYMTLPIAEVWGVFELAGTMPRDVFARDNHTYTAVFSMWEPMQPHERVASMQRVDSRIVILGQGKPREGNGTTIDFAFRNA